MKSSDPTNAPVVILDDDADVRMMIRLYLEKGGFTVREASGPGELQEQLSDEVEVCVFDMHMPEANGIECLRQTKDRFPDTQIIFLSASHDLESAVEAMNLGAYWYLTKPCDPDELLSLVHQAAEHARLNAENKELKAAVATPMPQAKLIGESNSMQKMLRRIEKVSRLDSTVLIGGETGTGKSTAARLIHELSSRSRAPFVSVSCAAIPRDLLESELFGHVKGAFTGAVQARPGKIEMSQGGTFFLDEIGDMPLELQPKLLTFLQERSFQRVGGTKIIQADVRVIAATHLNLEKMCAEKSFREDLYYRLNVLQLVLPPLRERPEDMELLAKPFLERLALARGFGPVGMSESALRKMRAYSWPGNIRELENVLERASAFVDTEIIEIEDLDLQTEVPQSAGMNGSAAPMDIAGMTLQEIERLAIEQTLLSCQGNKAQAARVLGISEKSIYNKMRRLGIFPTSLNA